MKINWIRFLLLLGVISYYGCSSDSDPMEKMDPSTNEQQDISFIDNAITALMENNDIPGAGLAISKDGKLVYHKYYGVANHKTNEPLEAKHSFRVASISKTFTGASIALLQQQGKLNFSDRVFGPNSILGGTGYSDKINNITIDHLLYHTTGTWGVASGGDPIDYNPDYDDEKFITYLTNEWSLADPPGQKFVYSNTGYYLLARIIEEISGKSYGTFMKQDLLKDINSSSLHVTNFSEEDRQPNEVEYYGQGNEQYIYTIADRRDGDAGVVITPVDLLRFVNAIDGFASRPDVLNSNTLEEFTKSSALNTYARGIGIWKEQNVWFHYGSLPGTRTAFMRSENGVNIVLLLNSHPPDNNQFAFDMQGVLLDIINKNLSYQDIDQF